MVEGRPGLRSSGNAILDLLREDYPFPYDISQFIVKIKKNDQIQIGNNTDCIFLFPIDILISLRCDLESGYTAEFSQIGSDGIVGLYGILSEKGNGSNAVALTSGRAYKIDAPLVRKAFEGAASFRRAILAYMEGHMRESAQRIVCSRYHSITQQVCRTLLMASDRLGRSTVSLTHEQLAFAIGCRREAVSVSAGKLQNAGAIRYGYGKITILDRVMLENFSCECYSEIRQAFAKFLPATADEQLRHPNTGLGNG